MNALANVFVQTNDNGSITTNARSLNGTAQLTAIAGSITRTILEKLAASETDVQADIQASATDHNSMDALIANHYPLETQDISFLKALGTDELDAMLKSQQSKRSRSKSKAMTQENYMTLMTGAVAENLIRLAMGKEKQAGGRQAGSVGYTAEELEKLAIDQDQLRRVLRNVQSKKSIMKSKEGFSEEDPRWLELLRAEEQLKGLRNEVVRIDVTKERLSELLRDIDIENIKLKDAKELLHTINELTLDSDPQGFNTLPPAEGEHVE